MILHWLEKYRGKTVDEALIEYEKEEAQRKEDYKLKEKEKEDFIDSLLKQKYFFINFNGTSIGYFKLITPFNEDELCSEFISFYKGGEISMEKKRGVNILWFGKSPFGGFENLTKSITEEEYLEVKNKVLQFTSSFFDKK
jgi:hypothetical protein